MTTLLISDPLFQQHAVPQGYPERPARLKAIDDVLALSQFDRLMREGAVRGEESLAELVHPRSHVELLRKASPDQDFAYIDADTSMSPETYDVALHALGSACRAVDAVMRKEADNAFVAARPPGHHAERESAMGFCYFNNVAVAARYAQKTYGLERIAIVDWDVHHGNGTQDIFWNDKSVLFCSTHEMPLYPGTGAFKEQGEHGTIVNAPLRAGDDGKAFSEIFRERIMPRVRDHSPDLILISAGFDAHSRDPLGNLQLEARDFGWATEELMEIAAKRCQGRIVSLLEGGYDLQGLSYSVAAHVGMLMGA